MTATRPYNSAIAGEELWHAVSQARFPENGRRQDQYPRMFLETLEMAFECMGYVS